MTNSSEIDFPAASVNIVFRDASGSIVGGEPTYIDGTLSAGATMPFSADYIDDLPEYATVEAYIDCGYPDMSDE